MVYKPKGNWNSLFLTNFVFTLSLVLAFQVHEVMKQLLSPRHAYWNLGRGRRDRLASDLVSVESYKGAPLRLASTFDNAPFPYVT